MIQNRALKKGVDIIVGTPGRTIDHIQNVTVESGDPTAFIDPPGDITITCIEAEGLTADNLQYSYTTSTGELIEGSVEGVISGDYDECGGTLYQTWSFTDPFGETIE